MKHFKRVTIARAEYTADEVNGILDRIFGFVNDLAQTKNKGGSAAV